MFRGRPLDYDCLASQFTPQELGEQIKHSPQDKDIAIVFGRERSGLMNEELDLC
jgi:tRNA C32,U32 (ribose-2'-O)-methylase TrmJ